MNELISKSITAVQLFSEKGLDPVLNKIRTEIDKFNPDIGTEKGRKQIASFARTIASSKVFIDKAGKELNADIKAKAKLIDTERKRARDTLDIWRDEVRQPLTEYENTEKERLENERLFEIFNIDHDEALGMNDLFNREKVMAEKEAKIAKDEEEKRQKEEAERLVKKQAEKDERLKKEASEKAELEAKAKIAFEKGEKERVKREAKEAKKKAERDKIAAEELAKLEKEQAIQKAKDDAKEEAQRKEQQRINRRVTEEEKRKAEKRIADRKAANRNHQKGINNKILAGCKKIGISEKLGKDLIGAIVRREIPELRVLY